VFPLELLPDSATNHDVLAAEQRWINRLQSKMPTGYNARNARVGVEEGRFFCMGRYYGTRDMCRRAYSFYKHFVEQRLTDTTHLQYFARFQLATLQKLLCFCRMGWHQNGASVTSTLVGWRVPVAFAKQLQPWVQAAVAARMAVPTVPATAACSRCVLVTRY
jgi:hypothetical protein